MSEPKTASDANNVPRNEEQSMGSIRYVSCSVAGSDPLEQPKENEADGTYLTCFHVRRVLFGCRDCYFVLCA